MQRPACRPDALWSYTVMQVMGLLPPLVFDGEIVVDGGYVNNLPVDTMFDLLAPETVVAVDVEDKDDSALREVYNFGDTLSVRCKGEVKAMFLSHTKCVRHFP